MPPPDVASSFLDDAEFDPLAGNRFAHLAELPPAIPSPAPTPSPDDRLTGNRFVYLANGGSEIRASTMSDKLHSLRSRAADELGRIAMLGMTDEPTRLISAEKIGTGLRAIGEIGGGDYTLSPVEEGVIDSVAEQISGFIAPETIPQLAAGPATIPAFIGQRILSAPEQYGRIQDAIRAGGGKGIATAVTNEVVPDLMAIVGGKVGMEAYRARKAAKTLSDIVPEEIRPESLTVSPAPVTETAVTGVPFLEKPPVRPPEPISQPAIAEGVKSDATAAPPAGGAAAPLILNEQPIPARTAAAGETPARSTVLGEGNVAPAPVANPLVEPRPAGASVDAATPPKVASHLVPDKALQSILDQQPVTPAGIQLPQPPPEGGAIFSGGGKRKAAPAIGTTPLGDKNWLRIPEGHKRFGKGLMLEGARGVLGRVKNQVGKALGKATRRQIDLRQELFGMLDAKLRKALKAVPGKRQEAAWTEAGQYTREVENKRPAPVLSPEAQTLVDAWYDIGDVTGDIARANNVQVWDAGLGAYRKMGKVTNYVPRMFKSEVEAVLRNVDSDSALFTKLSQDLATQRGISLVDAANELRSVSSRFQANDHMSNLEMARTAQMPESFYEYDLRNLAARYMPAFSDRMSQIIAYGQRLGPREAPIKKNLWDIAREEGQGHQLTQEWLNAAEDQATGFRQPGSGTRTALRAQALGNASLLSDPTTTVVRNLLSGIGMTTERFGFGRSFRELLKAGKEMSRSNAREIGVLQDDIGKLIGAEQLGDNVLDTFIKDLQTTALKVSGFSGSETFVRSHNSLVASSFVQDAAAALEKNPRSGLSKEALAQFKRWDIDPEAIILEKGNWKNGPESRKFIRTAVRESQGGYSFDQVPLWASGTKGRFLYQYGRWGLQRSKDIMQNTVMRAIGEPVEFRGERMTSRNVMPLIRLGMITIGLGETFGGIASGLFGRDRKDASFDEIAEAFSDNDFAALTMVGERITNDIIMAGTLGFIGQPLVMMKAIRDRGRVQNPFEPPSLAGVKALIDLSTKALDQGGTLTNKDLLAAAASTVRGPKNVADVVLNLSGEALYQGQNDQRTLRNAARRWADSEGMDIPKLGGADLRKSPRAPVFESINDALLAGNADEAKRIADEFIADAPDQEKAREAVNGSVKSRHPFRVGSFTAEKYRTQFLAWAKENLSEDDQAQIERVIQRYEATATEAGFLRKERKPSRIGDLTSPDSILKVPFK